MSNKERRAKADAKLREGGLAKVTTWVPKELKSAVHEFSDDLRGGLTPSEYAERVNDEQRD